MSEEFFNLYLSWVLFLTSFPLLFGAVVCLFWFRVVERITSKAIFGGGAILCLGIAILRVVSSYQLDNYPVRATDLLFILVSGVILNLVFYFAYRVQRRERRLRKSAESVLMQVGHTDAFRQTVAQMNPDIVLGKIKDLHPTDAAKLSKRLTVYCFD